MSQSQDWFQQFGPNLVVGLEQGSIYALVALGYTLVYGVIQLINFAHSEVFISGAFGSYLVVDQLLGGKSHLSGIMIPLTAVIGALTGAVCGAATAWTLEKVAYRPLRRRNAPKLAFLISAIGASLFLSNLAGKLFDRIRTNSFPQFFNLNHRLFKIGNTSISLIVVIIIAAAVVIMIGLDRMVNHTKLGRGIRAVAEDAPTAALLGINIDKTISRTFIIGGALAGVAGFLFAMPLGIGYLTGFQVGLKAFAAAVLGGIGNIRGAMIGGLILGVAEVLVAALPFVGAKWTDVISFVVLVLILLVKPTGILGERLGRAA